MRFAKITLLSFFLTCQLFTSNLDKDYVSYVNPLIGTDSSFELSKGNTYPAIARPWGMNFWTPQTGKMGDGWAYQYQSNEIVGFKQTHQPSPWINDYGAFSIMPSIGEIKVNEKDRKASFSHQNEIVEPHYYKVFLENINTNVEFTVTDRSSYFKIKFPKTKKANIIAVSYTHLTLPTILLV